MVGRGVLVVVAAVALVVASWAGLVRIGWHFGRPPASALHGPLLVLGFLGIVIGMERAVGLRRRWAWAVPALAAAAVAAMLLGSATVIPAALSVAGGAVLVGVFATAYRLQPGTHLVVMGMGAGCWLVAAAAWLMGASIPSLVPAMVGFLVLTIAGERLELARMIGAGSRARASLLVVAAVLAIGAVTSTVDLALGSRITGVGLVGVGLWLATHDVARRTVRMRGLTRYMAAALLVAYVWLGIAGALWIGGQLTPGTFGYDAAVHALLLGFVMSMVFGHAPVIIPSLTGLDFPYHPRLGIPLVLLHGSLALRVAADMTEWVSGRRWAGLLNVAALALFASVVLGTIVHARFVRPDLSGHKATTSLGSVTDDRDGPLG
jgi:hypothetical protein